MATIYRVNNLKNEILENILITKFETLGEAKIVMLSDGCVTVSSIEN